MAKKAATRIAEREQVAEFHRKEQGALSRAVSGVGLAVANTLDRIKAPFDSDRTVFAGATAFGLMRGAVLGGMIGVLGIVAAPAALGGGFLALAAATGAAITGIKDGQEKLERHWSTPHHQLSDTIAQKSGAVPSPKHFKGIMGHSVEQELKFTGHDPHLLDKADAALARDPNSFAAREIARRAQRVGPRVIH